MSRLFSAALVTLILSLGSALPATASDGDGSDLTELLEPIRASNELPALAGAIIHRGEILASGVVGVRRIGFDEPATASDLWHLGSCTKAMTATLIARLVEQGKMSWSTTIAEAFPDLLEEVLPVWHDVTVLQLLQHRSGLREDRAPDALFFALRGLEGSMMDQRRKLVTLALAREPASAPGSTMAYSNAGYAIAGAMAEAATGKSWEELLGEYVFTPLGMTSAGFGPPGEGQPRGHRGLIPVEPGPFADNPLVIGPAGTVHASLDDWAKFISVHLAGARGESEFLSAETFSMLHSPPAGGNYALGWVVTEREWGGGRVLTHAGSNGLWFAVTWIAPEKDMAVIVTTSSGSSKAAAGADAAASALIYRFYAMTGGK